MKTHGFLYIAHVWVNWKCAFVCEVHVSHTEHWKTYKLVIFFEKWALTNVQIAQFDGAVGPGWVVYIIVTSLLVHDKGDGWVHVGMRKGHEIAFVFQGFRRTDTCKELLYHQSLDFVHHHGFNRARCCHLVATLNTTYAMMMGPMVCDTAASIFYNYGWDLGFRICNLHLYKLW